MDRLVALGQFEETKRGHSEYGIMHVNMCDLHGRAPCTSMCVVMWCTSAAFLGGVLF